MTDANNSNIKMMIAAAIYLMMAFIVVAGLTLKGATITAANEALSPTIYQQADIQGDGRGEVAGDVARKERPTDDGRFDGINAKLLVAPAVQAVVRSAPRIVL